MIFWLCNLSCDSFSFMFILSVSNFNKLTLYTHRTQCSMNGCGEYVCENFTEWQFLTRIHHFTGDISTQHMKNQQTFLFNKQENTIYGITFCVTVRCAWLTVCLYFFVSFFFPLFAFWREQVSRRQKKRKKLRLVRSKTLIFDMLQFI